MKKVHVHAANEVMGQNCTSFNYGDNDDEGSPIPYPPYLDFSSVLFQMALKRHRQGFEHSEPLNLWPYPTSMKHSPYGFIEQSTSSAKIVNGSLLSREQTIYTIFDASPIPLPDMAIYPICPHYVFSGTGDFDNDYCSPLLRDQWADPLDHKQWKGLISCAFCYTEFRIDFRAYGMSSTAVFVTVWKDFGQGVSLSDPKWQCHTTNDWGELEHPRLMRGSICAAYEGTNHGQCDDFDFGALQVPWLEERKN